MKRNIVNYTFFGILWGCLVNSVINAIGSSAVGNSWFDMMTHGYGVNLLSGIAVGIGWTLPALVYKNEKLPLGVQTFIHLTVGFSINIPLAFVMGWVPVELGRGVALTSLLIMFVFAVVVWLCFYFYCRHEAKRINQRIDALKK